MDNERINEQEQAEVDNAEVTELEDKDLEDASGGLNEQAADFNWNCNC